MSSIAVEQVRGAMERALSQCKSAGADDVEISYAGDTTEFVRFANSIFGQVGQTTGHLVRVRIVRNGVLGSAHAASLDVPDIDDACRRAVALSDLAPPLDHRLSFAAPPAVPVHAAEPLIGGEGDDLDAIGGPAQLAAGFRSAGDGIDFFGALKRNRRHVAVLTMAGADLTHEDAHVSLELIARAGDGWGWAGSYLRAGENVDVVSLAGQAADIAQRARAPIDMTIEPCDVVLAPAAVAELIEWMAMGSFGGRTVLDDTSLLSGREGQTICSDKVTLREVVEPGDVPFDSEGCMRQPVELISAGKAGRPLSDLLTAARLGTRSTGHAAPLSSSFESGGPVSAHLCMEPGSDSLDELIGKVERGLFVTRTHYVNGLLDTRRATMTGMTREGTFLIEDGQIGRPVGNLRFTDSLLDALSEERLGGIGNQVAVRPSWWGGAGKLSVPAVLLRRFHWSGASR